MTRLAIASAGNSVGHHCPAWISGYVSLIAQTPVR